MYNVQSGLLSQVCVALKRASCVNRPSTSSETAVMADRGVQQRVLGPNDRAPKQDY